MRCVFFILGLAVLTGCAHDDARLQGTWQSNREATVAAAFERDPWWRKAPPEKLEQFRDTFGHLKVTYSKGRMTCDYRGQVTSFPYQVVARGADFVVVHDEAVSHKAMDFHIRFVDGNTAYWIQAGFGFEERFDKVQPQKSGK